MRLTRAHTYTYNHKHTNTHARSHTQTHIQTHTHTHVQEGETQLLELQRQSLVESLIGMGFPIDWALRAVVSHLIAWGGVIFYLV